MANQLLGIKKQIRNRAVTVDPNATALGAPNIPKTQQSFSKGGQVMGKTKKWTDSSDDKYDAKHGIKENSAKDKAVDKSRGVPEDDALLGKSKRMKAHALPSDEVAGPAGPGMPFAAPSGMYAAGGKVCMKCGGSVYACGGKVCKTCGHADGGYITIPNSPGSSKGYRK